MSVCVGRTQIVPTVDHVNTSSNAASFTICAWRTNDAKNDLAHCSFLELCERALRHAGSEVKAPTSPPKQPG